MTIAMLMNIVETIRGRRKEHEMRALRANIPDDQMICPVCVEWPKYRLFPIITRWMMYLQENKRVG